MKTALNNPIFNSRHVRPEFSGENISRLSTKIGQWDADFNFLRPRENRVSIARSGATLALICEGRSLNLRLSINVN